MSNDSDLCLFSQAKPAGKRRKNASKESRASKSLRTGETGTKKQSSDVSPAAERDALSQPSEVPEASEFSDIGLSEHLSNVCSALGMSRPTPVQVGVIPSALRGGDCIGVAETGSGKTAAFLLPILQQLCKDRYGVYALILSPTRELAVQLSQQVEAFGRSCNVRHCLVLGGMDQLTQSLELQRRPHIVVATPGRLADMLSQSDDIRKAFKRTAVLVVDEADRVLEPSFENDLATIMQALPQRRQTLLFTATVTGAVQELQDHILKSPCVFKQYTGLRTASNLREQHVRMQAHVKELYLMYVLQRLKEFKVRSGMIFCGTKDTCEFIGSLLYHLKQSAVTLHSGKKQKARLGALNKFKNGSVPILVATDVASRGLDIPTVDMVLNYDMPAQAEDYVHRVGRTARAGRGGWALSFVTQYENEILKGIEDTVGHELGIFAVKEEDVNEEVTKVFSARKAAKLAIEAAKRREAIRADAP